MTRRRTTPLPLDDDPLWYKDALIYELHVRSFMDSDGDGIGDFSGLTEKLDYLADLGVTALWLLPFYPSPLKDDGYDIADYTSVNPAYGTLYDFQVFLHEAHRRGLRVITELAINHTSDQHPWFQRARTPGVQRSFRDFYVWSDDPERYKEARVIFKDFESSNWSWDPLARAYYWHRFYAHQPDLNFDSALVRRSVLRVLDFWMRMGVDGLRLDAIPYLFERDGTSCENLPETHGFLKQLRAHVDRNFPNRMLLAEANQWPEDAIAYLGNGDECHMAFHFPVMPRLFMSVWMEDRYPITEILQQTPPIPQDSQWAIFLRNHDELTLEMVTDEDRDYMYRAYAHDPQMRINLGIRRRLAPLLGNHRRRVELLNGLLFSLPGTPVLYYGDELGMGDNIYLGDRNGVRTPMQWTGDRNAGFSRANPQRLFLPVIIDPEYHYEAVNVEGQQNNLHSLLWWTKRLIALRKQHKVFGRGDLEFLHPENRKVLAFIRCHEEETVLVVANLSRFAQGVALDLSRWRGLVPVEMFGRTEFPPVGSDPYFITLGPHAFYWFLLQPQPLQITSPGSAGILPATGAAGVSPAGAERGEAPHLTLPGPPDTVFTGRSKAVIETVLHDYLKTRPWFGGTSRIMRSITIQEVVPVPYGAPRRPEARATNVATTIQESVPAHSSAGEAFFTFFKVDYAQGDPETYLIPLAFHTLSSDDSATPADLIARIKFKDGRRGESDAVLFDAFNDKQFLQGLPFAVARRRRFAALPAGRALTSGVMVAEPSPRLRKVVATSGHGLEPSPTKDERSNTSLVYGNRITLKLYRKVDAGANPDLEVGRFLTERCGFKHSPKVLGALELRRPQADSLTLAVLHEYVPNEGDAWSYTVDALGRYYDHVLAGAADAGGGSLRLSKGWGEGQDPPGTRAPLVELARSDIPDLADRLFGDFLDSARLLGRRTAELHLALASDPRDPAFAPEPFTPHYQQALYQTVRTQIGNGTRLLQRQLPRLPEHLQPDVHRLIAAENSLLDRLRPISNRPLSGMRIRCHGDYHLGHVLHTGKDFTIIDFEGEPARPLSERRIKRSPLRDVAAMLRSFDYAARASLHSGSIRPEDMERLASWSRFWATWTSAAFLKSYLAFVAGSGLLPSVPQDLQLLLDAFLLEKAFYEASYEITHRSTWVHIPLEGILQLLETPS